MLATTNLLKNRYRILQALGSGAFGHTFVAEDLDLPSRRCCVLKQLKPIADSQQYQLIQERFDREAAILERLSEGSNGQIPKLYAYFTESNMFYLVQEWIDGLTLTQKVSQQGSMNEDEVQTMLLNLLPVLDYIHSQGIIHRDIKPDNIIARRQTNSYVLIDFGIVKEVMGQGTLAANPTSSIVAGTPAFMPLEQAAGKPLFSSDLYSLSLTAISALTGKCPTALHDPLTGEIKWREYARQVSPHLAAVLNKGIESHYRDRFKTAREMQEAILSVSSTVAFARPSNGNVLRQTGKFPFQLPKVALSPTPPQSASLAQFSTVMPQRQSPQPVQPASPVVQPVVPTLKHEDPPQNQNSQPGALSSTNSDAMDLAFWDSIKGSTNPKSYEAYLAKFPSGQFVELAKIRLEEMTSVAQQPVVQTFAFDTVTLDAAGNIIDFKNKKIQGLVEDLGQGITLDMVSLPAGVFQMGSTDQESEKPIHQVRVSAFHIGRFPVTQAQWRAVASYPKVTRDLKLEPSFRKDDHRPVEQVSWEDAVEFCERLSQKTGKQYRLPSEAEWEYAARATTSTPFAFGDTVTADLVNYDGNFPFASAPKGKYWNETTRVGSLGAANLFGLFDMHGNVNEWCLDTWNPNYKGAPANATPWINPTESKRVVRGGSWITGAVNCRSASRASRPMDARNGYTGFRVILVEGSNAAQKSGSFQAVSNPTPSPVAPMSPSLPATSMISAPTATLARGSGSRELSDQPRNRALVIGRGIKIEVALIPAGEFQMGSNDYENERPIHTVTLPQPFYMGKFPVTQEQWKTVMGTNPSNFKRNDNPVENVSWLDIQEFLKKLNERKEGFYYRLPSEAEWEYACRAGSDANFCFGGGKQMLIEYAWYNENSNDTTHPVGKKRANAFGLHDVHGNVYEWCEDWYHDTYAGAPTDGNVWDDGEDHEYRVLRGGSWSYYASYCRSSFRYRATPDSRRSNQGFRVVVIPM